MPIYEYRRPDGTTFELLQSFSDDAADGGSRDGCSRGTRAARARRSLQGKRLLQHRLRHAQPPARDGGGGERRGRGPPGGRCSEGSGEAKSSDKAGRRARARRRSTASGKTGQEGETARGEGLTLGAVERRAPRGRRVGARSAVHEARDGGAARRLRRRVRPCSPSGSVTLPVGSQHARRRRAADRQRREQPEQCRAAHVGDDRRRRVPGDPRQAQEARGREQPALHVVEQRLLVLLALDVGLVGRAEVLARARERERLLAVEVMRAGGQPQRVAAAAEAAVDARDMQPPV